MILAIPNVCYDLVSRRPPRARWRWVGVDVTVGVIRAPSELGPWLVSWVAPAPALWWRCRDCRLEISLIIEGWSPMGPTAKYSSTVTFYIFVCVHIYIPFVFIYDFCLMFVQSLFYG